MNRQVPIQRPNLTSPATVAQTATAVQHAAIRLRDAAMQRGDKEAAQVAEICLCLAQGIEDRELS